MKRSPWRKVGLLFVLPIAAVFLIFAIVYYRTGIPQAAGKYEQNLAAAKTAGLFFEESELQKLDPKVAPEENGFHFLQNLRMPFSRNIGNASVSMESFRLGRKEFEQYLAMIEQAASAPTFFPPEYELSVSTPSHTVHFLMEAASLADEDHDLALFRRTMLDAAFLTNTYPGDGRELQILLRSSTSQMIEALLARRLPYHANDMSWLQTADDVMKKIDLPYDPTIALDEGHFSAINFVEQIMHDKYDFEMFSNVDGPHPWEVDQRHRLPKFREAQLSRIHECYSKAKLGLPKDLYDFKAIDQVWDTAFGPIETGDSSYYCVRQGLLANRLVEIFRKEVSMRNAVIQAIELLRRKQDPAQGLPLKDRHANDYDDKPIRLRKLDRGWIVYSVWQDGQDDGGNEIKNGKGDFVIHLTPDTVPKRATPPPPTKAMKPPIDPSTLAPKAGGGE